MSQDETERPRARVEPCRVTTVCKDGREDAHIEALIRAIKRADFVGLDSEFTGLCSEDELEAVSNDTLAR